MVGSAACHERFTPALGRQNGLCSAMGLFGRLARLIRANLDDLTGDAGDPEKKLDEAIAEMGEHLIDAKNLVAASIAEEARIAGLGQQTDLLAEQRRATEDLKRALVILNDKIEAAKARRDTLRLRSRSARVKEAVHASASGVENGSVSELLDRLESQVERLEVQARVVAELDQQPSETAFGPGTAVRLPPTGEPVRRALGPVSRPEKTEETTLPVAPGDEKRTGR
jgi:phage shock protein A